MLYYYLKIALRNLRNNHVYILLNVFGLGLSIACSILIFILVYHHRSFDAFHSKADRIARFVTEIHLEPIMEMGAVPNPFATALRTEFACLDKAAMHSTYNEVLISVPNNQGTIDKYFELDGVAFAEPELFQILDLPLKGGIAESLRAPNTAIISEQLAKKYFGTTDVLQKTFRYNNQLDIQIVGVMANPLPNTDLQDHLILSWASLNNIPDEARNLQSWNGIRGSVFCYALVKEGHKIEELTVSDPVFYKKYRHKDRDDLFQYKTRALTSLHLDPVYGAGTTNKYLLALICIAVFLLVTACVNFINLATAQALKRAREVGVRKSLGSTKSQLFWQFMFETALVVVISVGLGALGAYMGLPYLNQLTEQRMYFLEPGAWSIGIFLTALALSVTFAAGAYPGILQARFQPVIALRGQNAPTAKGSFTLRRLLVTSQFAISQILLMVTAIILTQMQFARQADWGFRPGTVTMLPIPVQDVVKTSTLQQQLSNIAGIQQVSLCFQPPSSNLNNQTGCRFDTRTEGENWLLNTKPADVNYLTTFGLKLIAGRNFHASDTVREYVVNETFIKKLNLSSPEDVLMKNISIDGKAAPIVGVVQDYHNLGLTEQVSAIAFYPSVQEYVNCAVVLAPGNPTATLAQIKSVWESIFPNHAYKYYFLDEKIAEFLKSESTLLQLISIFSGIAIFIGCLGLYGLSAFMVARKRKEVGIRKTLGSTIFGIVWIFSKEYLRLMLLAFLISAPLAWWLGDLWLQRFAYHITPGFGLFGLALLTSFVVAALTVGVQSMRAALANPVHSLRTP
jgi:ABC-type antimicrobial peptide transport system permease subunit